MRRATDGNQAGIGDEVRGLFRNQDGADADQVLPQHRLRGKRGLSPSGLRPVPLVVDQVFADRRDGQVHIPDPPHLAFLKRAKGRRCCCWWRAVLHLPMMSVKADRGNCATTVPLSRRRAPPGWASCQNGSSTVTIGPPTSSSRVLNESGAMPWAGSGVARGRDARDVAPDPAGGRHGGPVERDDPDGVPAPERYRRRGEASRRGVLLPTPCPTDCRSRCGSAVPGSVLRLLLHVSHRTPLEKRVRCLPRSPMLATVTCTR